MNSLNTCTITLWCGNTLTVVWQPRCARWHTLQLRRLDTLPARLSIIYKQQYFIGVSGVAMERFGIVSVNLENFILCAIWIHHHQPAEPWDVPATSVACFCSNYGGAMKRVWSGARCIQNVAEVFLAEIMATESSLGASFFGFRFAVAQLHIDEHFNYSYTFCASSAFFSLFFRFSFIQRFLI